MDFQFSQEEEAFRKEVRQFLERELPPWWRGIARWDEESTEEHQFVRQFQLKLGQKGWLALDWPQEYGGSGAPVMKKVIFFEETGYYRAPNGDAFGLRIVGPTILAYGTDDQKKRHLPPITRGEIYWCQGFSEPNAGSDLASLQTRAEEDGDDFVINGQKIWNTRAHLADWNYMAVRTDPHAPKHRGLSYLLVDMKSPGITIRPIYNILGAHHFNEVFFDNVRVPKENLLGEKNQGWYIMVATLGFERVALAETTGLLRRALDDLVHYAKETRRDGQSLAHHPLWRQRLAEMAVEIEAQRMLSYRTWWLAGKGAVPQYEASAAKVYGDELIQRLANMAMQLLGLYGQLDRGSKAAPFEGRMCRDYLGSVATSIAGGTPEIQKNIIAMRGLGLPRSY